MSNQLVVHGFETSNNIKVRIALGYKGIPYEFKSIDPKERDEIVRLSGQYLTPVLVHDGRVLFDSAAILRYLDANFPATPKLFGDAYLEQWEIEGWERFGRSELAAPMMTLIQTRIAGGEVDQAMKDSCQASFEEVTQKLAAALSGGRDWLVGERMTAADITTGAVLFRIREASMFTLPEGTESLGPFTERVMAFDGVARV